MNKWADETVAGSGSRVACLLHEIQDGRPTRGVKPVLQRHAHGMALGAIDAHDSLDSAVLGSILRQTRHPFHSGHLFAKIPE